MLNNISIFPQAGSDEVGTGDTFGPVVVACAIVYEKDLMLLDNLNIKDSKELSDMEILQIAPKLIKNIANSYVILKNNKYNIAKEKYNLNEIKAILHNQVYKALEKQYALPKLCVIDQFCSEENFYKYLSNIDNLDYKKDYHFETKAENKYISVAIASIIARYYFLKEFDNLCKKYGIDFAKGSSNPILEKQIEKIIKKYGKDELNNVAKLHFKNVKNILNSNQSKFI